MVSSPAPRRKLSEGAITSHLDSSRMSSYNCTAGRSLGDFCFREQMPRDLRSREGLSMFTPWTCRQSRGIALEDGMDTQEMKRLYEVEGKSLVDVGKEAGTSAYFVRKALVAIDVRILPMGVGKDLPRVDPLEIRRLYESGMSQSTIGAKLGRCGSNIGQILRNQGVRGRTPQERVVGDYSPKTRHLVTRPSHVRAGECGRIEMSAAVVEDSTGRQIPTCHPIHHVNRAPRDNRPANLVVCEDDAYHFLIHYRARALEESGNANHVRCEVCGKWSSRRDPDVTKVNCKDYRRNRYYHKTCSRKAGRKWKASQKQK